MHTLHTTEAFVIERYEHGETSRVYKLFTREKGLVYAHAQGVREYKNKNRYALRTHARLSITLVRGRDVWRVTGAREIESRSPAQFSRVLTFIGSILPREVPEHGLFQDIVALQDSMLTTPVPRDIAERIAVFRAMVVLGYATREEAPVAFPSLLELGVYTDEVCTAVNAQLAPFTRFVNTLITRA